MIEIADVGSWACSGPQQVLCLGQPLSGSAKEEASDAVSRLDDLLERPKDGWAEIVEFDLASKLTKLATQTGDEIGEQPRLEAEDGESNLEGDERKSVEQRFINAVEDRPCAAKDGHCVRLQLSSAIAHGGPEREPATIDTGAAAVLHREIEDVCADLKRAPLTGWRVEIERGRR